MHVFQKNLENGGVLCEKESYVLKKLYYNFSKGLPRVDGVIFMDTLKEIAFERQKNRDKEADRSNNQKYMERICSLYEEYIQKIQLPV